MSILVENSAESAQLNTQILASLEARLRGNAQYTTEEIARVSNLSSRLFPANYVISEADSDQMRALCMLSKAELEDANKISSHRPMLGKIIVPVKRFFWRILSSQLRDTFAGLQEFQMWAVLNQAKLLVRISELEEKMADKSE